MIDILYMDTETEVLLALQRKWKQYDELSEQMEEIIKEYGLGSLALAPMGSRAIWLSCLLLFISFCLMFLKEDIEELEEFEHLEHEEAFKK